MDATYGKDTAHGSEDSWDKQNVTVFLTVAPNQALDANKSVFDVLDTDKPDDAVVTAKTFTSGYDAVVKSHHDRSTWILIVATSVTLSASLLFVVGLAGMLYRFKSRKMMRASSPLLLSITLIGASFVYIQCLVLLNTSTSHPILSCIISQWLYIIGFTLIYGSLGLKTWRVSVILLFYKSRQMHTKDKELVLRLLAMLAAVILYLVIWTFLVLHNRVYTSGSVDPCSCQTWGQIIAVLGEIGLLLWGSVMCYQARFAPALYNDTTNIGLALWNQIIWMINQIISRYYLQTYQDTFLHFLLTFITTECTVSTTLVLVFLPKFLAVLNKTRIVEGTLTDVYGPARIHKLTLVINKTGSVRTINCSPCGPLQDVDADTDHIETSDIRETRETEYSKDEVNSLIDLVSKLKTEKQHYKSQLRTLIAEVKKLKEQNGLNGVKWPVTPLLPDTPATADIYDQQNNKNDISQDTKLQNLLSRDDKEAKKLCGQTNGYNPKSYWVANILSSEVQSPIGNNEKLPAIAEADNTNIIRHSRTGDSLSTVMTSISVSPPLNPESIAETNLGLLSVNADSLLHPLYNSSQRAKQHGILSWDGKRDLPQLERSNSPESSIAQGYDNQEINEWLNQSLGYTANHKTKHDLRNGEDCLPLTSPSNDLNNPQAENLCCIVKPKCPTNGAEQPLMSHLVTTAQRPKTLTIAKRSHHPRDDNSVACYTKRTNFVFYI